MALLQGRCGAAAVAVLALAAAAVGLAPAAPAAWGTLSYAWRALSAADFDWVRWEARRGGQVAAGGACAARRPHQSCASRTVPVARCPQQPAATLHSVPHQPSRPMAHLLSAGAALAPVSPGSRPDRLAAGGARLPAAAPRARRAAGHGVRPQQSAVRLDAPWGGRRTGGCPRRHAACAAAGGEAGREGGRAAPAAARHRSERRVCWGKDPAGCVCMLPVERPASGAAQPFYMHSSRLGDSSRSTAARFWRVHGCSPSQAARLLHAHLLLYCCLAAGLARRVCQQSRQQRAAPTPPHLPAQHGASVG